ncbi:MAG TPA: LLM class F420-dependent oxidoreductase [Candidatus Eisenbacteria bacterium]|nr:LLM class F420-dependent oxidoreductase [Candidatus Eisenbacteria bacterium]
MRFGFALPQVGSLAGPEALITAATRAEALGYDTLWVLDRILWPLSPRAPYPIGDGSLPAQYKKVLDPVETLTFAAAHTSRIALATGVLNLPWYNPVLLARRLTTLDILSRGRLRVGFGIGWSPDEYEAAGVPWEERGKRADEAINVLKKIWATDPVEFQGKYYRIPKSFIGPKPLQKPHPPVYMAAFVPSALKRVAAEADGWFPVGIPLGDVGPLFEQIKEMAKAAGRESSALELIVAGGVEVHKTPIEKDRIEFTGTREQIAGDFERARKLGAAEIVIYAQFLPESATVDDLVARMEDIWSIAKQA